MNGYPAGVTVEYARHDGITIAYETFGSPDGEPILLIMGLGVQMVLWPDEFCEALAERGFAVARFDNRDAGLSTRLSGVRAPHPLMQTLRPRTPIPYHLDDMAGDALRVMDALGWDRANLVGVSMGGMIAQLMAVRHPERVRSLTSISSRPTARFGRPRLAAYRAMRAPIGKSGDDAVKRALMMNRVIGSRGFERDERWIRETALITHERGEDLDGAKRQLAAILACEDLRPGLAKVRVPTLVLHGEADIMAPLTCARAIAAAMPGARLVTVPGWGHDLPRQLWPRIIDEITTTTRAAAP